MVEVLLITQDGRSHVATVERDDYPSIHAPKLMPIGNGQLAFGQIVLWKTLERDAEGRRIYADSLAAVRDFVSKRKA